MPKKKEVDPRLGLPSSSKLEQIVSCEGSHNAQKGLPQHKNKDATHGTDIHNALAGKTDPNDLAPSNYDTYEKCKEVEEKCLSIWKENTIPFEEGDTLEEIREQRLYLNEGYAPVASGEYDVIYIHRPSKSGLILDYKTLFGDHTPAPGNYQLRIDCVMAADLFFLENLTVGLVQPNVSPQYSLCSYGPVDIETAKGEIMAALVRARDPEAARTPGAKQCRWCLARGNPDRCPESVAQLTQLSTIAPGPIMLEDMPRMAELYFLAKPMLEHIKARLEDQLGVDEYSIHGYGLGSPRRTETITDPLKIFAQMAEDIGVEQEEFLNCMTAAKGKLQALVGKKTGLKGKALKNKFDEYLKGHVNESFGKRSLVKL